MVQGTSTTSEPLSYPYIMTTKVIRIWSNLFAQTSCGSLVITVAVKKKNNLKKIRLAFKIKPLTGLEVSTQL